MSVTQFFLKKEDKIIDNEQELNLNKFIINNKETYHHLINVLKLNIGEEVNIVFNGKKVKVFLEDINKKNEALVFVEVKTKTSEETLNEEKSNLEIYLFQGIPKASKMELVIEKGIELGADVIIPVEMQRSVVRKKDIKNNKIDRWKKIAESAAKQSKRNSLPEILEAMDFKEFLYFVKEKNIFLITLYEEENITFKEVIQKLKSKIDLNKIGILVGPEGGISKEEIEKINNFLEDKHESVFLGKRILRTETAPLAALAILGYELDF